METQIDITSLLDGVRNLPSLPTIASRVVGAATDESASVKEISDLIEKDIALTTRLLQVVNSSLYGFNREIEDVNDAVGLMGFRQVGNLAMSISVADAFPKTEIYGFDYKEFWERCISNAVGAVLTGKHVKGLKKESSLFTSSLVQDIGTCILVNHFPLAYGNALGLARERGIHPIKAEREVLGTDHAEIGAELARRWNLPTNMQTVIRHHHFVESEESINLNGESNLVKVANLADIFTNVLYEPDGNSLRRMLDLRAKEHFGLTPHDVADILAEMPREIETVRTLFEQDAAAQEDVEDDFFDHCPKCSSHSIIHYCGDCGASLLKTEETERFGPGGYKVLVAEDSEAIRTALVSLLRKRGYKVFVALDGEEAVNLTGKEQPDLVLMDVRMPVMDGIETLKRIRSDVRSKDTPIVMLTSVTNIDTVTEAVNAGANDYVAKPFTIKKLLSTVEKYTAKAHGHDKV